MAPLSAPSMMLMPTAKPASGRRNHPHLPETFVTAARARKIMPAVNAREPRPQHTLEKKLEFKAAARPATTQSVGLSFIWRKNTHAQSPRTSIERGARNFAKPTGPSRNVKAEFKFSGALPP